MLLDSCISYYRVVIQPYHYVQCNWQLSQWPLAYKLFCKFAPSPQSQFTQHPTPSFKKSHMSPYSLFQCNSQSRPKCKRNMSDATLNNNNYYKSVFKNLIQCEGVGLNEGILRGHLIITNSIKTLAHQSGVGFTQTCCIIDWYYPISKNWMIVKFSYEIDSYRCMCTHYSSILKPDITSI